MRGGWLVVLGLAAACPRQAHAALGELEGRAFPLALARVEGEARPELILAQRAIEREWPAPGDSGVLVIPGERSELGALVLSAAVPGAGQVYAGSLRGLYFAVAEVAGWVSWLVLRHRADDLREEARVLAGAPGDSSSAWSFSRYETATEQDASYLKALYDADPEAFDEEIAHDARYQAGWSSSQARAEFAALRGRSDQRLTQSRIAEGGLWVNHVVAALDALRAARLHNLPLRQGFELKADGGWHGGRPGFTLALERRF